MNTLEPVINSREELLKQAMNYSWELYDIYHELVNKRLPVDKDLKGKQLKPAQLINTLLCFDRCPAINLNWDLSFHHYTPGGSYPWEGSPFRQDVIVYVTHPATQITEYYHLRPLKG